MMLLKQQGILYKALVKRTRMQVVASSGKLNLRRDLRWVTKRSGKLPHKNTRVAKISISKQTYPVFHWLIIR